MTGEDDVELRLIAGRAQATRRMRYLSKGLYAMTPVESAAVPTAAVDKYWRMYWNRRFIESLTVEEIATVWLHEIGHLTRHHSGRAESIMVPTSLRREWNKAGDATINADLRESGILVFNWMIFPETIDPTATFRDTTEYLYEKITGDGIGQDEPVGSKDPSEGGNPGGSDDDAPPSGKFESDDGKEDDADPESADAEADGGGEGDTDGDGEGDGGAEGDADRNGEGDTEGEGDGEGAFGPADGAGATDNEDPGAEPGSGDTDCGSGSGGPPRPWDLPPQDDDGSVSEARAQTIRTQIAHDIIEYASSGIGTVPAGMERWAEQYLNPQVDWRRELRASVRRVAAQVMGRSDFSYHRPRRVAGARGVILPGMVDRPPPVVRVIVDTSGSMDGDQLGAAVAEISEIIKRITRGGGSVDVIACDAAVAVVTTIRRPGNIELKGGGGTDMRVGIQVAAEATPSADLVITLTDGFTPWPDVVPPENRSARYLAVIVPTVRGSVVREAAEPPAWMHTIRMQAA